MDGSSESSFLTRLGWSGVPLQLASPFFFLGEPQAIKLPQHSSPPIYWFYYGPKLQLIPAELDSHWQTYLQTQDQEFFDCLPLETDLEARPVELADDEAPF